MCQDTPTKPLYRCSSRTAIEASEIKHRQFISVDSSCEGLGTVDQTLGYLAVSRGGEMLRALCATDLRLRCLRSHTHAT